MKIVLFFSIILFNLFTNPLKAQDLPTPQVFNITHELSMGKRNNVIQKDYYLTLGENQGIFKDTLVDVYRVVSKNDPYQNNRTYTYKIIIGTLRIIHSQSNTSVARIYKLTSPEDTPIQDVHAIMIGDYISIR